MVREIAEGRSAFRSLVAMSIKYEKAASGKGRLTCDVRIESRGGSSLETEQSYA